jgi:hypothetical protein
MYEGEKPRRFSLAFFRVENGLKTLTGRGYCNVRLTLLEGLNRLLQRQADRGAEGNPFFS